MARQQATDVDKLSQLLDLAADPGVGRALDRASEAGSLAAAELQRLIIRLQTFEPDFTEIAELAQNGSPPPVEPTAPAAEPRRASARVAAASQRTATTGTAATANARSSPARRRQPTTAADQPTRRRRSAPTPDRPPPVRARSTRVDPDTAPPTKAAGRPATARGGPAAGRQPALPRGYEPRSPKPPPRPPRGWATEPEMCKPEAESLLAPGSRPDWDSVPDLVLPPSPGLNDDAGPLDRGQIPDRGPRLPMGSGPSPAAPPELGLRSPRSSLPGLPASFAPPPELGGPPRLGGGPGAAAAPRGTRRSDLGPPPDLSRWTSAGRAPERGSREAAEDKPARNSKLFKRGGDR